MQENELICERYSLEIAKVCSQMYFIRAFFQYNLFNCCFSLQKSQSRHEPHHQLFKRTSQSSRSLCHLWLDKRLINCIASYNKTLCVLLICWYWRVFIWNDWPFYTCGKHVVFWQYKSMYEHLSIVLLLRM